MADHPTSHTGNSDKKKGTGKVRNFDIRLLDDGNMIMRVFRDETGNTHNFERPKEFAVRNTGEVKSMMDKLLTGSNLKVPVKKTKEKIDSLVS